MDYQNLDQEIKEYLTYFKYCDSIYSKFSAFFKEYAQSGTKFILKSKKSIDEFCNEINRIEYFPTTLNKNLNNYCDEFKEILNKMQDIFTNVEKDIINKINEFENNYKNDYKNFLNQLNNLNIYLAENKNKLEKIKNNYFDSCKQVQEFNKKYISGIPKEENLKYSEQYEKLKQASEAKKVYYRIEVTKFNDLLLSNESYYLEIINSIAKQEENRSQFYANILLLLNNNIKHFNFETKDLIIKNEKFIDNIFTKRDIKMFSLYFNKTNNNKDKNRFLCEEFFDFENISESISNNEIKENDNNNMSKNYKINKENEISEILKIDYILAQKLYQIGKEPMMIFDIMDNEYIELDNIILDLIQKKEKIDNEKFLQIINLIEVKSDGCKKFIYILMNHYLQKNIVKFNCVENIFLLNSILNIIINYIWENDEYTYLAFIIIYIGERTIYNDQKDKKKSNYLCKIMAKNSIYHINDFWNKLINLKIKIIARIRLSEELIKRKKNNTKKETGLMYKFFGVTNDEYDRIENEILYSQLYKDNSPYYLEEVLEKCINHFICYEFCKNKTIELIEQLSEQYNLSIKQKNYFIKMIKSSIIYIKEPNPYFILNKSSKINSKIKYKKIKNKTIQILLFAMNYLSKDDIISIFTLNKECYSIIKKYYYKNILIKHNSKIDFKKHISIWRLLLGYQDLKKKYNYKELKETIITKDSNNIKNKNIIINNDKKENEFDTIELDCIRTSFRVNQEENQKKLSNILKVISKQIPSIYYCQGMNHIAGFLLVLCEENEEEGFYLYLGILLGTEYCSIIDDDLMKLNSFFYCFERILNLMFPEMYNFLNNNNINGGFFLSPWFITLFTLAYDYQKENNNKEIIVKLFDLFIFNGWKAIFKIGISLIKFNSLKIFSLPYEKLVHYLNNDIIHSDFFMNENFDEIMNVFINCKISNNLINNLYEEYEKKKNIINKNNLNI